MSDNTHSISVSQQAPFSAIDDSLSKKKNLNAARDTSSCHRQRQTLLDALFSWMQRYP